MASRIPGAQSTVTTSVGLVSAGNAVKKPIIIGVGDIKVLVENEKVTRGATAGGKDVLAFTLYDSSSVVTVGNSRSSADWDQTTHWVVDTNTNSLSWEAGADISGSDTLITYGVVATGDTVAPYNTFTATTGSWSAVDSYYVGGTLTVTNPDSSNYGATQTITGYTGATRQFVTGNFTYAVNVSDTFIVSLEPDEPASGNEYYVTYYKALNTFTPTEYVAEADIKAFHGDTEFYTSTDESALTKNKLVIGSLLALRNGAESVIVCQLDNTSWGNKLSPTESEFNASLSNMLETLKTWTDNKYFICPVTTNQSSITKVWEHAKLMSSVENKGERVCVAGLANATTLATFKSVAQGYVSTRMILTAPGDVRYSDLLETTFGGDVMAAAYAGKRASTKVAANALTGQSLEGILVDTTYTASQQRELLGAGVALVESRGGIATIVHDKSTNPATADTEENSVVDIADHLNRTVRDTLWRIHRGSPIDASLLEAMAATMASIYEQEIKTGNITEYKEIAIQQSSSEPRLVQVNSKVRCVYTLTWIDSSIQLYV